MLDSARWRIAVMGRLGFYAKTIIKSVKRYDGTTYSASTIYKVLKEEGVSLRSYRDGSSRDAKKLIKELNR